MEQKLWPTLRLPPPLRVEGHDRLSNPSEQPGGPVVNHWWEKLLVEQQVSRNVVAVNLKH